VALSSERSNLGIDIATHLLNNKEQAGGTVEAIVSSHEDALNDCTSQLLLKLISDITGGIEKFLAKENFRKILKVSHFYSGFS